MKIALVEAGDSHDECLYSQIKILKSSQHVYLSLICNDKLRENTEGFDLVDEKIFIPLRSGLKRWWDIFQLKKKLLKEKYQKIIFNTAQGTLIKKLFFFRLDKKAELIGILHNTSKLENSYSQKIISKRIHKYILLRDHLLQNIKPSVQRNFIIETFYPIYFPDYQELTLDKNKSDIWICIPGQVELQRRDYTALFDSIRKNGIKPGIKFILPGRCEHLHGDGRYVKEEILKLDLKKHFILWDDFIDVRSFHSVIKKSDFILPLIHSQHVAYSLYRYRISGAFNLAICYKIPLLLEAGSVFSKYEDFKDNSIFYETSTMMQTINTLQKIERDDLYKHKKWEFSFQREKYLRMIDQHLP